VTATYLAVAVVLLLANGFFVGAEFALIAARRTRIEQLASEGNARASTALASIRELSFMLAGAQLGITMASLGLGFVAEPAVARVIESGLHRVADLPDGVLHSISFVVALGIVVFFHMVVGEMAPKNIAIAEPERTALRLAVPMRIYVNVFRLFIRLLNALANGALRLMRVEPVDEVSAVHTPQEISTMIVEAAEAGMLEEFNRRLLSGAIELGARDAGAAMVPRTEITAVPSTATPADVERVVVQSGHSRIPVFSEDIDHVLGFVHAKDLLRMPDDKRDEALDSGLFRQMLVVPESRKLRPLLIDMRRERRHLVLVIDEHGGTAGVVTLEDLLEELVGEIRDEYDVRELGVERLDDRRFVVPGSLRIDEAGSRLGVDLPAGDYETVAGFVMDRLGRIPTRRDAIEHDGWRLRVRSMQRRRVVQVLIEPIDGRGAAAGAVAPADREDA
jgi:CBS domain containing-hemolysin-like protein